MAARRTPKTTCWASTPWVQLISPVLLLSVLPPKLPLFILLSLLPVPTSPVGKSQAPVFDVFEAFINTDNIQVFANAATDYIMCLMKFVKGLGLWLFPGIGMFDVAPCSSNERRFVCRRGGLQRDRRLRARVGLQLHRPLPARSGLPPQMFPGRNPPVLAGCHSSWSSALLTGDIAPLFFPVSVFDSCWQRSTRCRPSPCSWGRGSPASR